MTDLAAAYWKRAVMLEGPDACWEWAGIKINGRAYLSATEPKRLIRVTRFLWERLRGPIPTKGVILHRCDHPWCVRMDHLTLGTQADNMRDMAAKGRSLLGSRNPHAKLTAEQVRELRRLRAEGWKLSTLAERYGIDQAHVSNIARRVSWKHV